MSTTTVDSVDRNRLVCTVWTAPLFDSVATAAPTTRRQHQPAGTHLSTSGFFRFAFRTVNASYSVAAVATLLIGGIVIDRIGTKKAITFLPPFAFWEPRSPPHAAVSE